MEGRRLEVDMTLGWDRRVSLGRVHDGSDVFGGWLNTFGCGTNGDGLIPIPRAVEVSSSSSSLEASSSEWEGAGNGARRAGPISSLELLIGGSDSLSLSSYSSWLLLAVLEE
jgi:hypothetical protein